MILTRNVTRSFDMYHEVEITDELIERLSDQLEQELDLEQISNMQDYSDIWNALDDMHWNSGDIIFQEYERMPNQNYDDIVQYDIQDKTSLIEPEAL